MGREVGRRSGEHREPRLFKRAPQRVGFFLNLAEIGSENDGMA